MSSNAILNRAAQIISTVSHTQPVDFVLRKTLSARSDLLPHEKRQVSETVFAYYRWLQWLDESDSLQSRLSAANKLQERFKQSPDSFKNEALAARAVPAWLKDEMDIPPEYLRRLQTPPTLWIRAQEEFKAAVPRTLKNCKHADISALKLPVAPDLQSAFAYTGNEDLFRTNEFQQGLFEIQDLASQLVGHACDPKPRETWWDTCAGEGGKTLHLADLMHNQGLIWVSDRNTRRLATLRKRAGRAQVFNYRSAVWNGGPQLPTKTKFDGILIDAPCSGVGTWQRNPHARWTTTQEDVNELAEIQFQLISNALPALKPGGRLIYAVCTLTRSETSAITEKVADSFPELKPSGIFGGESRLFLWPQDIHANGMFIAAWQKP